MTMMMKRRIMMVIIDKYDDNDDLHPGLSIRLTHSAALIKERFVYF